MNIDKFDRVMEEIKQERKRQTEKWGEQDHSDAHWLAILIEEVGEIAKEIVEAKATGSGDGYSMRKEIIHAVAVGVQWLEKL